MERSDELHAVYLRIYEFYNQADIAAMARSHSQLPGVLLIGTDPTEWVQGYEAIIELYRHALPAHKEQGITLVPGDAQAHHEGDIGWIVDRPMLHIADGSSVPLRATTIFRREDGDWKMVHTHFSLGVPNEQIEAFQRTAG